MKRKNLYVLISDGGDGSHNVQYTMNDDLIAKLEAAADDGKLFDGIGCDGDGFHYDVITVPVECTPESLGISVLDGDYADQFDE